MKGLWWSLYFEFRKDVFIYTFSKKFPKQAKVVNKSISRKHYYAQCRFNAQTLSLSSSTFCCVCVNRIKLCNYLCPSSSPSSRFSTSLILNIGEFGTKKNLQAIEQLIQFSYLFPRKIKFSSDEVVAKWNSHKTSDNCSHLFICTSLI